MIQNLIFEILFFFFENIISVSGMQLFIFVHTFQWTLTELPTVLLKKPPSFYEPQLTWQ